MENQCPKENHPTQPPTTSSHNKSSTTNSAATDLDGLMGLLFTLITSVGYIILLSALYILLAAAAIWLFYRRQHTEVVVQIPFSEHGTAQSHPSYMKRSKTQIRSPQSYSNRSPSQKLKKVLTLPICPPCAPAGNLSKPPPPNRPDVRPRASPTDPLSNAPRVGLGVAVG